MHRIATAMLIAAAVLVLNGGLLRDAFAADTVSRSPAVIAASAEPIQFRSPKVLSLLMILESLRQAPVSLDGQKV